MKFFNTAGPVRVDKHYCLSPLDRIQLSDMLSLIEQEKYFILHAPRQTGKTTALLALRDALNQSGNYVCLYVNVEDAQTARNDVHRGIHTILAQMENQLEDRATAWGIEIQSMFAEARSLPADSALGRLLKRLSQGLHHPFVLLIDEIDSLVGDTLISVLRQLRSGYPQRPEGFPQSVVLCGVRDVQDYRIHSEKNQDIITGGSAFNIKAESLRLGNFTLTDIRTLYLQHTTDTGQVFEDTVFPYVWTLTEGQPWLVNALAYEACWKLEKDRTRLITRAVIEQAKENIILRRDTHIDILIDKLSEPRVRRVIEPILYSEDETPDLHPHDVSYVVDMGLIQQKDKRFQISNAIYREIIPRELVYTTQYSLAEQTSWYVENGKLRMDKLLIRFQEFFRDNSEAWLERFAYKEAGPHLLLMAFLQRIINGGGKIDREYGLGMKRMDLLIEYADERFALELKVISPHRSKQRNLDEGIPQLTSYMDTSGAKEGHLILFDRRPDLLWETKLYHESLSDKITLWGM